MSMTRSLWIVSRCAKARLQPPILLTRYSFQCRFIHAPSLADPVNFARSIEDIDSDPSPSGESAIRYQDEDEKPKKRGRKPKFLQVENNNETEAEMPKRRGQKRKTLETENHSELESETPKRRERKQKTLETQDGGGLEGKMPKRRVRTQKTSKTQGDGELEDETPKRRARTQKALEIQDNGELEDEAPKRRARTQKTGETQDTGELEDKTPKRRARTQKTGDTQDSGELGGKMPERREQKPKSLPVLSEPISLKGESKQGKKVEKILPPEIPFYPSSNIPKLHLPPSAEWKKEFPSMGQIRYRPTVRNPSTARMLAEAFVPEGSIDKIIIEAFPGPGQLSRSLLSLPRERIKKLIVIEPVPEYYAYLEPLTKIDDRVILVKSNPRDWVTYTAMAQLGLMKHVETTSWDQVHPHLQFIMQTAGGVDGERVATQLLRTIPDRQWLFKYGRMPMSLILSDRLYERFTARESAVKATGATFRCKAAVIAQTVSNISEVVHYDDLQPYLSHFFPEHAPPEQTRTFVLDALRPGNPRVAIQVVPLQHQLIKPGDLDVWDYVLRKLFVVKGRPIEDAIVSLGPGARNLLSRLVVPRDGQEIFDLTKRPRDLIGEEWNWIVEVFKNWPFRPTNLGVEQLIKTIP